MIVLVSCWPSPFSRAVKFHLSYSGWPKMLSAWFAAHLVCWNRSEELHHLTSAFGQTDQVWPHRRLWQDWICHKVWWQTFGECSCLHLLLPVETHLVKRFRVYIPCLPCSLYFLFHETLTQHHSQRKRGRKGYFMASLVQQNDRHFIPWNPSKICLLSKSKPLLLQAKII